jgi:hypothetical protein
MAHFLVIAAPRPSVYQTWIDPGRTNRGALFFVKSFSTQLHGDVRACHPFPIHSDFEAEAISGLAANDFMFYACPLFER